MKKVLFIILSLAMFICITACKKKADAVDLNSIYTVNAHITYDNCESDAELTRMGGGAWNVVFTSPENINGMTISNLNGQTEISYEGMSFTMNSEDMPSTSGVEAITNSLEHAAVGIDVEYTEDDGMICAEGTSKYGTYIIKIDKNNNAISSMDILNSDIHADFSEYAPMK